jgi:hypothetical protein
MNGLSIVVSGCAFGLFTACGFSGGSAGGLLDARGVASDGQGTTDSAAPVDAMPGCQLGFDFMDTKSPESPTFSTQLGSAPSTNIRKLMCPPGTIQVGLRVQLSDQKVANNFLSQSTYLLEMLCAPMSVDGSAILVGTPSLVSVRGSGADNWLPASFKPSTPTRCAANELLVGLSVRSGARNDAFLRVKAFCLAMSGFLDFGARTEIEVDGSTVDFPDNETELYCPDGYMPSSWDVGTSQGISTMKPTCSKLTCR